MTGDFDARVNAVFEPLRGRPGPDSAAALVSNAADYGLIWVLLAAVKVRRRGPRRRRAVVALGAAGVSSLVVSRAVKASVDRQRPDEQLDVTVRTPSTSSFPSGHTLAAYCTALTLPETGAGTAAAVGFATAVATSRVHLRAHHPSDVVGGAVIGAALGLVLRRAVDLVAPGRRHAPTPRMVSGKPRGRDKGMTRQDYWLTSL